MTISKTELSKQQAAERAAELIEDGMSVGLGSGTTAHHFVRALGSRVATGLTITAVSSSMATAQLAESLNIPLGSLETSLDIAIDGADIIEKTTLHAIKGLGGALVREKLVALAATEFVLIADKSKLAARLADRADDIPVSVEILPFGWRSTRKRLEKLGSPVLRRSGTRPYVSDNHNYIIDLYDYEADDIECVAARLKSLAGVVDHGLFLNLANRAIIGYSDHCEVLHRTGS